MTKILGDVGPARYTNGGRVEVKGYYSDGSIALTIIGENGPEATPTICLAPDGPVPPDGCVWLKGWSENEGIPDALEKAGIAQRTGETYFMGPIKAELARLYGVE